jgi:Family of unknown function (DUF6065)/Cupin-like domain
MDLICYLHPGWEPLIRPAEATREWMDRTPESFAYRCLPLNIANAHGWEILSPCTFDAVWNGGNGTRDVSIDLTPGTDPQRAPVSIFGQGILTFHVEGIFRTPPGWNLWIGGSPNSPKDGIFPLSGVVETDWSPFTFTMNWRFTRRDYRVRFERGEPFCFVFPVRRGYLDHVTPRLVAMTEAPDLLEQFKAWSKARDEFHANVTRNPPKTPADRWQKHYYRGVDMTERSPIADHATKLRLAPFAAGGGATIRAEPADAGPAPQPAPSNVSTAATSPSETERLRRDLARRDWLLDAMDRHRALLPLSDRIERRTDLSRDEFLERYYAQNRPVILAGEMADWPALARWTPQYLRDVVGAAPVQYQGERSKNAHFEMEKDRHLRTMPFDRFIDMITAGATGNDAYITAYNSASNAAALAPLYRDLGTLDKFLAPNPDAPSGMMWIGPAGTITSLHHDLTNNLIAQIVGRKRFKVVPAAHTGKVYNHRHIFSEIVDLEDPALDRARFPQLAGARIYDVVLEPGEMIFMPLGWWHQVRALDFSVTVTYTNFLWPNEAYRNYPGD